MDGSEKKYSIILADPPWEYRAWSNKGQGRSAVSHYPVMKLADICALPVADIAADDCVLFIWGTWPNLLDTLKVIEAWGFTYKTVAFMWVKQLRSGWGLHMGMGHWTRANTEAVFLATKGKPHRVSKSVRQVVLSPLREHSRKPEKVHHKIVELMGDLPRIELFARRPAPGWDVWGNEVDGVSGLFDMAG